MDLCEGRRTKGKDDFQKRSVFCHWTKLHIILTIPKVYLLSKILRIRVYIKESHKSLSSMHRPSNLPFPQKLIQIISKKFVGIFFLSLFCLMCRRSWVNEVYL